MPTKPSNGQCADLLLFRLRGTPSSMRQRCEHAVHKRANGAGLRGLQERLQVTLGDLQQHP